MSHGRIKPLLCHHLRRFAMSYPKPQSHQKQIFLQQKRQLWVVFACVLAGWLFDVLVAGSTLIAKGVLCGALLSYIAQSVFTWLAYRTTGVKYRQTIMLNVYLGQIIKWLITLLGFALIFMAVRPINALAVFAGYFITQLLNVLLMWRVGR